VCSALNMEVTTQPQVTQSFLCRLAEVLKLPLELACSCTACCGKSGYCCSGGYLARDEGSVLKHFVEAAGMASQEERPPASCFSSVHEASQSLLLDRGWDAMDKSTCCRGSF
jgi:hypothetical protein